MIANAYIFCIKLWIFPGQGAYGSRWLGKHWSVRSICTANWFLCWTEASGCLFVIAEATINSFYVTTHFFSKWNRLVNISFNHITGKSYKIHSLFVKWYSTDKLYGALFCAVFCFREYLWKIPSRKRTGAIPLFWSRTSHECCTKRLKNYTWDRPEIRRWYM
jgi:hypothetical protein